MNDTSANPATPVPGLTVAADERPIVPSVTRRQVAWLSFAGVFLFSMLWGIGSFGIQDNNEGIYAEVAREMNARGDWVVPHLNGVPYLEKPPLLYWIVSSLLRVFGNHEWAVRLGPVLCFAGTIAAVLWIGRQIRNEAFGRHAALLLCSAIGVVAMSRSLLFDGPLTCALTWAFAFFLRWRLRRCRWSLRAIYLLLGVGVLAKGLIALVLGGGAIVSATFLARRSWRDVMALIDPLGAAVFGVIVVPWHLLASLRQPGFAEFYFVNEHLRRFLGSREPHDFYTGPFYYYLVRLPLYLGVWAFALPLIAGRWSTGKRGLSVAEREARRLFASATVLAITFFSFSEGKANYYLLCIMPAIAVLIALRWPKERRRDRRLFVVAGGVGLVGAVFGLAPRVFAHKPDVVALLSGQELRLELVAAGMLTLAVGIVRCARRGRNKAAFWCTAAAGLLILLPVPVLLHRADGILSERAVARFLANRPGEPVVLYRDYEKLSSVVFYLGHPVPVVESESNELYYASHHLSSAEAFLDPSAFHALASSEPVWLITTPARLQEALTQFQQLGPRVAKRFPSAVVIRLESPELQVARRASTSNPDPAVLRQRSG